MKKYKFNPYERAVGVFIMTALFGSCLIGLGLAVKKDWFEDKMVFNTYVESAENLREGSAVFMSGLKVGKVEALELDRSGSIKVTFNVLKKHAIKEGTKVQLIRPFILGDKAISLIPGPEEARPLSAGEVLAVNESVDLLDILKGKKLEGVLVKVDSILNNLDQTLIAGRDIAQQMGGKKKLKKTMDDLQFATSEVRKAMPYLTSSLPEASLHLNKTIANLSTITEGLKDFQTEGTQKTRELLEESTITLKSMQRSFFLRGNVEEVKKEMAQKASEEKAKGEKRAPASE